MKRLLLIGVFSLFITVISGCGKEEISQVPPPTQYTETMVNPAGNWEHEYLSPQNDSGKSKLVVSEEKIVFWGKIYFKVTLCEHDKSLRGIRIHRDEGSLKIDWLIEKNPADRSGELGMEQSAILKVDGAQLQIGDYQGNPFATLTKK